MNILDLFSVISASGLLCFCIQLSSMLKKFFCCYFLQRVENVTAVFRFILWALAIERTSTIIYRSFSCITEIIWNSHFSSKPVCSGTNSLYGAKPATRVSE